MAKLRTPFVYEDKIRGLNDVGVLTLPDEIRQVIESPICDKRPVDNSGIAAGRFLRGTQSGVSTQPNGIGFDNVEYVLGTILAPTRFVIVEFAQVVSYVLVKYRVLDGFAITYWNSLDGSQLLLNLEPDKFNECLLRGDSMRFGSSGSPNYHIEFDLYGFY